MAAQSTRVHTGSATAASPDLVKLHMQAVNSLERCKAMLLAREPMYLFAQQTGKPHSKPLLPCKRCTT